MHLERRETCSETAWSGRVASFAVFMLLLAGCAAEGDWPPPRDAKERLMIESAERALRQHDGWSDVACVVRRIGQKWQVQAWKIVHPEARGRRKCVPWAVRYVYLDNDGEVMAYQNSP